MFCAVDLEHHTTAEMKWFRCKYQRCISQWWCWSRKCFVSSEESSKRHTSWCNRGSDKKIVQLGLGNSSKVGTVAWNAYKCPVISRVANIWLFAHQENICGRWNCNGHWTNICWKPFLYRTSVALSWCNNLGILLVYFETVTCDCGEASW